MSDTRGRRHFTAQEKGEDGDFAAAPGGEGAGVEAVPTARDSCRSH